MEKLINYVFMSFRNPTINKNLGVCIVKANTLIEATQISHEKGINPGGEIMSFNLSESQFEEEKLELDRLYTKEELENKGYKKVSQA